MSSISHAQLAIAQLYEQITPETKRQIKHTAVYATGLGFLALAVLLALHATFEPFVWAVLLIIGARLGFAISNRSYIQRNVTTVFNDFMEDE